MINQASPRGFAVARRLFRIAALWLALVSPVLATQATLVTPGPPLPMTGLAAFLNSAFLSVGSCNGGNSAPTNGTGGAAFPGECWINTSSNPWVFSYTADGVHWSEFGTLNTSTFAWTSYSGGALLSPGISVLNPGTGTLEQVLPPQTVTGASKTFATADLFKKTRRSNSGSAMSDTFPASSATGMVNGTRIVVANVDASATLTITAGAGTVMSAGTSTDTVGPGRDVAYEYDLAATQWRRAYNTGTALLGPNNLSDIASAATARGNLGLGNVATQNAGTGLANSGANLNLQPASASVIGGVESITCATHLWLNTISILGVPVCAQPGFSDLTGAIAAGQFTTGPGIVTLAMLNNTGAGAVFTGNPTGSAAARTDFTLAGLTALPSPSSTLDLLPCVDHTTGTIKSCTPSALSSSVGSGVTSLNGQTGALTSYSAPQGRLTLTSGVAITTTDVAGAATLFYTPAVGNICLIYDGTNLIPTVFTQLSQATTDTTKSPAAVAANSVYFIVVWNDSGTLRATRTYAWASDTSPGTGSGTAEVDYTTPLPTNKWAITNGPAANRGIIVGAVRSNASSLLMDTQAFRWVSNIYNATPRTMQVTDPAVSWTYTTAAFEQAHANSANQLDLLQALPGGLVSANVAGSASNSSGTVLFGVGIDLDTLVTTGLTVGLGSIGASPAGDPVGLSALYAGYPGQGRHILIWKEYSAATGTTIWFGTNTTHMTQAGIQGVVQN